MADEKNNGQQEIRQLVRLLNADVPGDIKIFNSLLRITGVSFTMAHAVCQALNLDRERKIGSFSEDEIQKIVDAVKNPAKYGIPSWVLNRRKASETGEDLHLLTSDLKLAVEFDIKKMKKLKTYKGVRHSMGQPVRGQRTRSHFRKAKGKTGGSRTKVAAKPMIKPSAEKEKK